MVSPRWKKLWRDLQMAQGRMIMIVIAIAVSIFAVGTILSAYTILSREISRNYLDTNPASAFLELDHVDDSVIQAVKQQPDISDAEATSWVTARIEVKPNEWKTLLLFVIKDFSTLHIDTFQHESGSWPPPNQTILLERVALDLIHAKIGDSFTVQTPNGPSRTIAISGTVHDPGLAPAWQEETVYGYISPSTLAWLGESNILHILKVIVKDQPQNINEIDAKVGNLANWLKKQGYTVGEIRIPPPAMHPHQSQMNSILTIMLIFAFMALLLSAILTATMINSLLAQQILSDYGTSRKSVGSRGLDGLLSKIRGLDSTLLLALRNTFRRRGRLLLTLILLASAGAMFMTGINVKAGWENFLSQGVSARHYDLEIRLSNPQPKAEIFSLISGVPGVQRVESWNFTPAAVYRSNGLDIVRTYPDGGHGSFLFRSAPLGSNMLDSPILSGRWLNAGDTDGVVLNQMTTVFFPDVKIGDSISLVVNDHVASFHVVGIARQVMTPAAAYVLPATFADATKIPSQQTTSVRIVMNAHDANTITTVTGNISRVLEDKNISVLSFIPKTVLEGASDAHVYIFIYSLVAMAVIMAVVGVLGLMSSMGNGRLHG
jgi:hypothetical protein